MRITDGYPKVSDHAAVATEKVDAEASGAAQRTPKAPGDAAPAEVHFSDKARALAAQKSAGFDEAKIERLRSAIDAGSFAIDAAAIAERLVQGGGG